MESETTMRRYRLPPLDPLVAFEAAARHLSFTHAADELALTQSAVSRQIQALESSLGVALFQRLHRALALTDAGLELSAATTSALQQLHNVAERVGARPGRRTVVVTTTPGFAGLWLIPRLGAFTAQQPGVDVRISATYVLADLERDGVDIAVRYCAEVAAGADSVKLFGESVMPLCSPKLLADASRGGGRAPPPGPPPVADGPPPAGAPPPPPRGGGGGGAPRGEEPAAARPAPGGPPPPGRAAPAPGGGRAGGPAAPAPRTCAITCCCTARPAVARIPPTGCCGCARCSSRICSPPARCTSSSTTR